MKLRYEEMLALVEEGRMRDGPAAVAPVGGQPAPWVPAHLRPGRGSIPGARVATPAPSRASRTIGRTSRRSMRLGTVRPKGRDDYDSLLEYNAAAVLRSDPRVADVRGQPPAVDVVDGTGRAVRHTPDLAVDLHDGRTVGVLARPADLSDGLAGLVGLFSAEVPAEEYDGWTLVSEVPLTRDVVHQAELVDWVRRDGPTADCPEVVRMRAAIDRRMTVAEAIAASGTGPDGFRAVVRLVADRDVRVVDGWRIHHGARVEPANADGARAGGEGAR